MIDINPCVKVRKRSSKKVVGQPLLKIQLKTSDYDRIRKKDHKCEQEIVELMLIHQRTDSDFSGALGETMISEKI